MIILNSLEAIKDLFVKRGPVYSDRPIAVLAGEMSVSHHPPFRSALNPGLIFSFSLLAWEPTNRPPWRPMVIIGRPIVACGINTSARTQRKASPEEFIEKPLHLCHEFGRTTRTHTRNYDCKSVRSPA